MVHALLKILVHVALASSDHERSPQEKKYKAVGEREACGVSVSDFRSWTSSMASPSFVEKSHYAHDAPRRHKRLPIEPIIYLHIPKCGSGFATAVLHLECGNKIDKNLTIEEPGEGVTVAGGATKYWNNRCGSNRFLRFESAHAPLDQDMTRFSLSKVVMMVRPPEARISSGYLHNLHDCKPMQKKYNISENGKRWRPTGEIDPTSFRDYAACVQSCMTNMLIGNACGHEEKRAEQLASNRQAALARLPLLGFVGLTDHWDLSICLWHAKFGGDCLPAEFANLRPGPNRVHYDERKLGSPSQFADQAIYERAADLFAQELAKHHVNPHTCATRYCPAVAHLFGGDLGANSVAGSPGTFMQYTADWLNALTWPGRMIYSED